MAKRVASKWLQDRAHPEFRVTVYPGPEGFKNLPGLLRSFRDAKVRISSLAPIPDLGMEVKPDRLTVWSKDREALLSLEKWVVKMGCETTGIW